MENVYRNGGKKYVEDLLVLIVPTIIGRIREQFSVEGSGRRNLLWWRRQGAIKVANQLGASTEGQELGTSEKIIVLREADSDCVVERDGSKGGRH
jgi:hypothetical protein